MTITNVCFIGAGYVGGSTSAVIAQQCPNVTVTVVDINDKIINQWNSDILPIYEFGLYEIVKKTRNNNLIYSTDISNSISKADVIFICVNTPTKLVGIGKGMASDTSFLESATRLIGKSLDKNKKYIIVEKSTVPVHTSKIIKKILQSHLDSFESSTNFEVLSNPEFLAEGTAVNDLLNPDRILIGGDATESGRQAVEQLVDLYSTWIPREKILTMNTWSSELTKLAANAFLAQRLSSINSIGIICEEIGGNIDDVSHAVGMDKRIGPYFLKNSLGYGGSCFRKDLLHLVYLCQCLNLPQLSSYWKSVIEINDYCRSRTIDIIVQKLFTTVSCKRIGIFGFSFKKDTADTRDSSAIFICKKLLEEGAVLSIYDPKVPHSRIKDDLNFSGYTGKYECVTNVYEAVRGAHAVVVCTEWNEFKELDYNLIYSNMLKPAFLFDGRNYLDHETLRKIGFDVYSVGKSLEWNNSY